MAKVRWRERIAAAAIHFVITLLVSLMVAGLIFFIWFPGAFAEMIGGKKLFFLVICSDLALGPLISLVIFNSNKSWRELIVDYSIVSIIQISALVYGVSAVAFSRPVFVVFTKDRFEVVSAIELDDADLSIANDAKYKTKSWFGPVFVAVQFPTDVEERNELLFSGLNGKDAQLMPRYYRAYETQIDEIRTRSLPLEDLISRHPDKKQELELAVAKSGRLSEDLRWLPVHHRFGFWTALLDAKTGYPVKYLPIDPY